MKLGILSTAPRCYSTRRMVDAAKTRGHKTLVINSLKCSIDLQSGKPDLYYKDSPLANPKVARKHEEHVATDDIQRTALEHLATNIQVTEPNESVQP